MTIKARAPVFELDHRELRAEALDEALGLMGQGDFLLVYKHGAGYRAIDRREASRLRETCSREGRVEVELADAADADPIVHGDFSRGELKGELDRLQPTRQRLIHVGRDGLRIVYAAAAPVRGMDFSTPIGVDLFMPPGDELPRHSEALGVCAPLIPASRSPGQPFLERLHSFVAVPGSPSRLCAKCGAECTHPAEQRLPDGNCGRCGAELGA